MSRGVAVVFKKKFEQLDKLRRQKPAVGKVLRLRGDRRFVFYLVTKKYSRSKPLYKNLWRTLWNLKREMEIHKIKELAVPKLGCGLDQLDWRTVRNMLEVVFRGTDVQVLVCSYHPSGLSGQDNGNNTLSPRVVSHPVVEKESQCEVETFWKHRQNAIKSFNYLN
ncbi:hypothetical protein RN001_009688 [Aquatica leii]|uniref:Macro domain-containing protein n=1 Tax=Aquatica leii TaxID=1421715 RepID=A0AAN7P5K4_9COLE|nr:hypothetical protein RN001_009688 [Aquatica leii]